MRHELYSQGVRISTSRLETGQHSGVCPTPITRWYYSQHMLAYVATKQQFLDDAPVIEDKIEEAVRQKLGIRVSPAEKTAWRNSLGNAMSHFARNPRIPDDAGVAIEYRLNGRRFRIDFMLSGKDLDGRESLVVIELKQWTDVRESDLKDHVRTFVGGGVRDEHHPSYQAWSYSSHLRSYNEYIYSNGVQVNACAYLHNCDDPTIVKHESYCEWLCESPVFIKGELDHLVEHVTTRVSSGDRTEILTRIDSSPIRPSKPLADAVGNMLQAAQVTNPLALGRPSMTGSDSACRSSDTDVHPMGTLSGNASSW